jgi:hypothetical protein
VSRVSVPVTAVGRREPASENVMFVRYGILSASSILDEDDAELSTTIG